MIRFLLILLCCFCKGLLADTMEHYMAIAEQLPQMEMKADPKSQSWARSARSVLTLTHESIAETLLEANEAAMRQGKPLFCMPETAHLNAITLQGIILQAYRDISSQQSDKASMSVSQVALLGVIKAYPCAQTPLAAKGINKSPITEMPGFNALPHAPEHMDALVNQASR